MNWQYVLGTIQTMVFGSIAPIPFNSSLRHSKQAFWCLPSKMRLFSLLVGIKVHSCNAYPVLVIVSFTFFCLHWRRAVLSWYLGPNRYRDNEQRPFVNFVQLAYEFKREEDGRKNMRLAKYETSKLHMKWKIEKVGERKRWEKQSLMSKVGVTESWRGKFCVMTEKFPTVKIS